MRKAVKTDSVIQYLLGELSKNEQEKVEDLYFSDDGELEQLLAIEDELINDYVRGELSGDRRQRFENYFLNSPGRMNRVQFARAYLKTVAEHPVRDPVENTPPAFGARSWKYGRAWILPASVAALCVLLIAGGIFLLLDRARLQGTIENMSADLRARQENEEALKQEVTEQRSRSEKLSRDLELAREDHRRLAQRQFELVAPSADIISIFLLPAGTRGRGPDTTRVSARDNSSLRIRLAVPPDRRYVSYRVVLRDADDHEIVSRGNLRAVAGRSGKSILLSLPSAILVTGDYKVGLYGTQASGQSESVEDYWFALTKK